MSTQDQTLPTSVSALSVLATSIFKLRTCTEYALCFLLFSPVAYSLSSLFVSFDEWLLDLGLDLELVRVGQGLRVG